MKKIILVFQLIFILLPGALLAQQRTVRGVVKDATGPLPGATILEKGLPTNGVAADINGQFQLTLKGTSNTIIIKSIGFIEQERKVPADNTIDVVMQVNAQGLDEVVVVGFGVKERITNTGSVSAISGAEVRNVPTANVQNSLAGRLPGFVSQQRSGQPGRDASDFFIRGISSLNAEGNRPLIIVDDIEYTYEQLSQINVNEIESISILKDASTTAIYGIKGANGVLVVRTRRGATGKPRVNVRVETGMQTPVRKLSFLDSYQSAMLANEAIANDNTYLPADQRTSLPFTDADLELFRNGQDPYGHPNVNWYKEIFRPYSMQANTNIDISGGTESIKYFISGGALTQDGAIRDFSTAQSEVNSNYLFNRYNFRTNLDIQTTKTLSLRLDMTGRFGEINEPFAGNIVSEIYSFRRVNPYAAPVLNPDGSYAYARGFGIQDNLPTINARLATKGYNRRRQSDLNILVGGTQALDGITKGLSFTGRVAYASTWDVQRGLFRLDNPPSYLFNPETGAYRIRSGSSYTLGTFGLRAGNNIDNRTVNIQAYLNYDRTFGRHHIYSLALLNQNNAASFSSTPSRFKGYSYKVGYDFEKKYIIDINVAYNGSDRFQAENRYGLFPAVGVGWNLAEESFIKDRFPILNLLKLRGSYGMVGSDRAPNNQYLYNQIYFNTSGYSFGEAHTGVGVIREGALGNNNVTWEKETKADIGLDMNLFSDKLSITVDYFNNRRFDQLVNRNSTSAILGVGLPAENLGIVRNRGWDGQISYINNIGNVQYNINGVFSIAKNKVLFKDEPLQQYPWLTQTGHPINQPFGYTVIGFYQDENDIATSAKPNISSTQILPGDLKYKDLNGDDIIDENDMSAIGRPNLPNTTVGLTTGANYGGLSLSILFQGSFNYSLSVIGTGIEPFQSQFQPIHLERWTPENQEAKFPRLTQVSAASSPSAYPSDFWLVDAAYVRLKTVELGYQLPTDRLPIKLSNARLYLSAYNLVTWTNYNLYQQDPEVVSATAGDAYLNQRVVNLGLQIGF